jgi:hypothetical protein
MLCKSFQALTRPVSAHVAIDLFFQTAIFPSFVIVESGLLALMTLVEKPTAMAFAMRIDEPGPLSAGSTDSIGSECFL